MTSFSIWHWITLLFFVVSLLVPWWKIVSKAGYSGAWSILGFIPFVGIVALWIFAFSNWPMTRKRDGASDAQQDRYGIQDPQGYRDIRRGVHR